MRNLFACLAAIAFATAAPAEVVPRSVLLHLDETVVTMSDGTRCYARPQTEDATRFSGQLEGCATPLRYEIALQEGRQNLFRQAFEWAFGPPVRGSGIAAFGTMAILSPPSDRVFEFRNPRPDPNFSATKRGNLPGLMGVGVWRTHPSARYDGFR